MSLGRYLAGADRVAKSPDRQRRSDNRFDPRHQPQEGCRSVQGHRPDETVQRRVQMHGGCRSAISEYANSQNKVNAADFFVNHPFHVRKEDFSKRIFAPSPDGTFRESKWFYERARGQFQDERSKLSGATRRNSTSNIAHAGSYPTTANWKLVVENFFECYHCVPSHPEFCSMHASESIVAVGAGPSSGPADAIAAYAPKLKAWEESAAALGRPIGTIDDAPDSSHLRLLMQRMNKSGWAAETKDGTAPAPLMGKRTAPDGGRMHLSFSPFSQIVADDHFVILFQFTPRSALESDVEMIWLVDGRATEAEVDIEKMIWGYHATTTQDKVITENNQAGIMSSRYRPGRYSDQEGSVIKFQQWYLNQFGLNRAG
jgi:hypothetical protein